MDDYKSYFRISELLANFIISEEKVMPPELEAWALASPENRATLERLLNGGDIEDRLKRLSNVNVREGWARVSARLGERQGPESVVGDGDDAPVQTTGTIKKLWLRI